MGALELDYRGLVSDTVLKVDVIESLLNESKTLVLAPVDQALYVLQQENFGQQDLNEV